MSSHSLIPKNNRLSLEQEGCDEQLKPRTVECTERACDEVFARVFVSFLRRGGTTVLWELDENFTDPMPYTFQLQFSKSAVRDENAWEDVGDPVVNQFMAVDGEQRFYAKTDPGYYRVRLDTENGAYYSRPTGAMGRLPRRDWRLAREAIRQERVRMRFAAGEHGVLLKRRTTGVPCSDCRNSLTQEVEDPTCPRCLGTGFECGYFFPIDCVWADISPESYHTHTDTQRGTVSDVRVRARMINTQILSEEDVFVGLLSDMRYYVHKVQNVAEHRGVPLIANVELRPAPVSDVIYSVEIPQQLEHLDRLERL